MNTKLINHEKYWLLVDTDSVLKIGNEIVFGNPELKLGWNWGLHKIDDDEKLLHYQTMQKHFRDFKATRNPETPVMCEAIIAHLPKDNYPILEGVPLLPELPKQEEDVVKLAKNYIEDSPNRTCKEHDLLLGLGFIAGYKAASKKKWSDEDVSKAIIHFYGDIIRGVYDDRGERQVRKLKTDINTYLQSLSPVTLPIDFKPEYENEYEGDGGYFSSDAIVGKHLKTVKNEAGIEALQGEWIYQQ